MSDTANPKLEYLWFLKDLLFIAFLLVQHKYIAPRMGQKKHEKGLSLEKEKKYQEALASYVLAVLNRAPDSADCRVRIKRIWDEFGPFYSSDTRTGMLGHWQSLNIIDECVHHPLRK